ncbi:MAG: hypothetical protein E4G90_09865, partial [Gemmatimonadales bacterium]
MTIAMVACLYFGGCDLPPPEPSAEAIFFYCEYYNCPVLEVESLPHTHTPTTLAPPPAPDPTYRGMGNQTTDVEQWRSLVTAYFPGSVDLVMCLIRWESGGNPNAINQQGSGARGLLQVMPFWAEA